MRRWRFCAILMVALIFGAFGCGSSSTTPVTIQISPVAISVVLNTSAQFVSAVTGNTNTAVTWTVACATGVTTCGTIDMNGNYSAPSAIPSTPTATVTATSQADTTKTATATITIISGISITVTPAAASVGTGEHLTFNANVGNPGCVNPSDPNTTCFQVTWSLPATAGVGSIDANGVYTAPATIPSTPTVTITATSTVDTTVTATATVTVVTAVDPTLTSVSPNTAGLGSAFQDVFLTGANFIATTSVYINGALLDPQLVGVGSSSVIGFRVPSSDLFTANTLTITASRQSGGQQGCSPDVTKCQIVIVPVRPAVVGPSPDTEPQAIGGSLTFNINGGFFGTPTNPAVSAKYDGSVRGATISTTNAGRQLGVTIGGAANPNDFGTPGLHQVAISNNIDPSKIAVTNIAVQPDFSLNIPAPVTGSPFAVGSSPVDVAINTSTGLAVVVNNGSNDVTLFDLTTSPPTKVLQSLCTGGGIAPCPATGPTTIATGTVNINGTSANIALVANSTTKNVAVINLDARTVTSLIPLQDAPAGVGLNPSTGRALVSMNTRGYGVLLDLTQAPPVIVGIVSISSGPNSHIAVEPHLNWAVSTPGDAGSLGVVDLNRQTVHSIASVSRNAAGTVTVTVQPSSPSQPPLAVQPTVDAVLIQGVSDTSFNGIYTVTSSGPGNTTFTYQQTSTTVATSSGGQASYSQPVATVGIATSVSGIGINTETQQAVLTDPSSGGSVSFFNLLDQTVSGLTLEPGYVAGAYNSLTNVALVANKVNNQVSAIDPTTPKRIPNNLFLFMPGTKPVAVAVDPVSNTAMVVNQTDNTVAIYTLGPIRPLSITDISPKTFELDSTLSTAPQPPANLAVTLIGNGFTSGTVPRLDGVALPISAVTSVSNRKMTFLVPGSLLSSARRFAVDVLSSGVLSNAADFAVTQSVDVGPAAGTGCSNAPLPTGVAIDPQQGQGKGLAVVSLFGCNTVAIIDLAAGTGSVVAVGSGPLGVAVDSNLHSAVVANNGGGTASVVDELQQSVTSTIAVGSGPIGVATDESTDEAAVANSVDNTVSVMSLAPGTVSASNTIPTGARPVAVAFNYRQHLIAVASSGAGSVSIGDAAGTALSTPFTSIPLPTSVVYDPFANNFLANASLGNKLFILDASTQQETGFGIGINPTFIAFNYLTSTLVSTNAVSRTLTVADFLDSTSGGTDRRVRAVLSLPPAPPNSTLSQTGQLQLGMDIQPLTNLAVVADTANGRVLFIPLPH